METILNILKYKVDKPKPFGLYHIVSLIIIIALCVYFSIKLKDASEKKLNKTIFISWFIITVFEIYKQIVYSASFVNGNFNWDYKWYIFPFQFCSTPFYVMPLVLIIKNQKIKDALHSFLAFFSLFGGAIVLSYPAQVFETSYLGVLLQTMVHHGIMVIISIVLIVYNRKKLNLAFFLKGLIVFTITIIIAQILNEASVLFTNEIFNMFYISSRFPSTLVILKDIYPLVPYPVIPILYFIGFSFIGYLIYLISKAIYGYQTKKGL